MISKLGSERETAQYTTISSFFSFSPVHHSKYISSMFMKLEETIEGVCVSAYIKSQTFIRLHSLFRIRHAFVYLKIPKFFSFSMVTWNWLILLWVFNDLVHFHNVLIFFFLSSVSSQKDSECLSSCDKGLFFNGKYCCIFFS